MAFDNTVVRAFLRAAAVAFALGSDAMATEIGEPVRESGRHGQAAVATLGLGADADIVLLDSAGRTVLRLHADGPLSLIPPAGGPYLLRVTRQGVVRSRHIDARDGAPPPIRL